MRAKTRFAIACAAGVGLLATIGVAQADHTVHHQPSDVAIYGFDEGSGVTVRDLSKGNHGTQAFTSFSWNSTIKKWGSHSLREVPDYAVTNVQVVDSPSLQTMTNAFTVEGWGRLDSHTSFPTFISRSQNATNGLAQWAITHNSSNFLTAEVRDSQGDSIFLNSFTLTPLNTFFHMAMTFDSTDTLRLYINGTLVASGQNTAVDPGGIGRVVIGGYADAGGLGQDGFPWRGYFDEIRLSNVALLPGDGSGNGVLAWNASITPEPATAGMLTILAGSFMLRRRRGA